VKLALILFATTALQFAGVMVLMEVGRRLGTRRMAGKSGDSRPGLGALEGAVFAVLGLLLSFTFAGALARFEARRDLATQETNAIGTAWLRVDLLQAGAQPEIREAFRRYVDTRLRMMELLNSDPQAAVREAARSDSLQGQLWRRAVTACQGLNSPAVTTLVLSSFNEMFDMRTTRLRAMYNHPPAAVFATLFIVLFVASFLAGFGMAGSQRPSWTHIIGFALTFMLILYVIGDLEFPRSGLIRVNATDQTLIELRQSMEP
jgi:hypothetical protein